MMAITPDDVLYTAHLVRLGLRPAPAKCIDRDLGPVLEKSHHPSDWHRHRGRVLVRKEFSKEETIRKVALVMRRRREEAKRAEAEEREASFR